MSSAKTISFEITHFQSVEELNDADQKLVRAAHEASKLAYAPYSKFNVGAAVGLANGEVVIGSNKENASFPAGICAERNAIYTAMDAYPDIPISVVVIFAKPQEFDLENPVTPCGICRQVMCETENHQNSPIRILLVGNQTEVIEIASAAHLLPLHFHVAKLKK